MTPSLSLSLCATKKVGGTHGDVSSHRHYTCLVNDDDDKDDDLWSVHLAIFSF